MASSLLSVVYRFVLLCLPTYLSSNLGTLKPFLQVAHGQLSLLISNCRVMMIQNAFYKLILQPRMRVPTHCQQDSTLGACVPRDYKHHLKLSSNWHSKHHYFLYNPHSHPNGFYQGHQCSWTLTPANTIQVSIMQFDNCNRKYPCLWQDLNLICPRSLVWMGAQSAAKKSWSVASTVMVIQCSYCHLPIITLVGSSLLVTSTHGSALPIPGYFWTVLVGPESRDLRRGGHVRTADGHDPEGIPDQNSSLQRTQSGVQRGAVHVQKSKILGCMIGRYT